MSTGVLLTPPIIQFFDNTGSPAVGGSVLTQIGGNNAATYQDIGLGAPLPNPIPLNSRGEVSTSGGASAQCFLTPNQTYTFTLYDAQGNQLWVATYVNGVQVSLTQSAIGAALWPYNATFDGAPVVNTGWPYGDPRRFGAVGDDATDDTAALIAWASGGGALTVPNLTFLVSNEITLVSNTTIAATKGATIHQSVADKAIFRATSQSKITIRDLHFKQTAWGGAAYVAHALFDTCTSCLVEDCEFEGVQWAGVYFRASSYCTARTNRFHDSFPILSLTLASAPNAAATSATLSANWAYPSGTYTVAFVETAGGAVEGKSVTFTAGATTATWSGGLSNNCNAAFTVQSATDSGDILVQSDPTTPSNWNVVDSNFCFSNTLSVGVSVQDPYSGVLPTRNSVKGNKINDKLAYGILVYMPDSGDSYNDVVNNEVDGILGSFALNQSSGAGIYVVGAGAGGTTIASNRIRNCCRSTAATSLAPGGIGISGTSTGTDPLTVTGNNIDAMSQYHGIIATGILGGASITGNTIRQPASNTTGHAVYVVNGNAVSVVGNTITQLNTTSSQRGILFIGITLNGTNHVCVGNTVNGGHISQVECAQSGGGQIVGLVISSNSLTGGDSSCIPLLFNSGAAASVQVTGNYISSLTSVISQTACTNIQYTGNRIGGPGATALFITSGTCTGTFFDRSNIGLLAGTAVNNGGTGAIVEVTLTGNSDPAAGTFAVGDMVWRTDVVTGQRLVAACTVAGTSGTWKVVNLS